VIAHRGPVLAQIEPAIARATDTTFSTPIELSIDAVRLRALTQTIATFVALAEETTVLLVLDDLECADELTLAFLDYVVVGRAFAERPIFVVLAADSDRSESLAHWLREHDVVGIDAAKLDAASVRSLVADMLGGRSNDDGTVSLIASAADGVALHAVQLAHLDTLDLGLEQLQDIRATTDLRTVVEARVGTLPDAEAKVAAALAVLGNGASTSLLARVACIDDTLVLDATAELLRRRLLHELEPDAFEFVHATIGETVFERLDEAERVQLHSAAAAALERESDASPFAVARQWEAGSSGLHARAAYLRAAREARSIGAIELATRSYLRYFELDRMPSEELAEAHLEFASDILGRTAVEDETLVEFEEALACARQAGSARIEARCLRTLAIARKDRGELTQARDLLSSSISVARKHDNVIDEAAALRGFGMVDAAAGLLERSRSHYEQALSLVMDLNDRREEASLRSALAVVCAESGDLRAALDMFDSGYALARETGDLRVEANILANLAILYQHGGHLDQARQAFEGALANLRVMGNRRHEGVTLAHLAALYEAAGRDLKALALYESSLAIHREVGNTRAAGVALQRISVVEGRLGDVVSAREHLSSALALLESAGTTRDLAITLIEAAPLERRFGNLQTAATLLARAAELSERAGDPSIVASCLCEQGHQMVARGQSPSAIIEQVLNLARTLGAGGDTDLGRAIARLQRSVAAAETGEVVIAGEYVEDLPRGVRRLLEGLDPARPSAK
jgi:tetratricopeptide (TPR) repeat protein